MASLKKNSMYNIILSVCNVIFPLVTAPYISRVLGVENIGVVNFAISYATYFAIVAALGVPKYGIRAIAKKRNNTTEKNKVFSELFWLITMSTTIVSILYFCSIYTIDTLWEQKKLLMINGALVISTAMNIEWYFSGEEKFKLIAIRSVLVKALSVVCLFWVVQTSDDIVQYLLIFLGAQILNQLWNWLHFFGRNGGRLLFGGLEFKHHIKPLFMLFAVVISISVYTILDTVMLGLLSNYTQVSYYTQAHKIILVAISLITALGPVMLSRVSSLNQNQDQQQIKGILSTSFGVMITIAIPMMVGMMLVAPYFTPFFFGEDFAPASPILRLFSPLILIIGLSNIYVVQLLQPMGYDSWYLRVIVLGAIVNVVINLSLIPNFGAVGATIGSVLAEFGILIGGFIYSKRVLRLNYDFVAISQCILSCLPMVALTLILQQQELSNWEMVYYLIPGFVISYLVMLLLLRNKLAIEIMRVFLKKLNR